MDKSLKGIWGNPKYRPTWSETGFAPEYPTMELIKEWSETRPRVALTPIFFCQDYDNYLLYKAERCMDSYIPFGFAKGKGNFTGIMNVLPGWTHPIPESMIKCDKELCEKCRCPLELLKDTFGSNKEKLRRVEPEQLIRKKIKIPSDETLGYALLEEQGRGQSKNIPRPWAGEIQPIWTENQFKRWNEGKHVGLVECHKTNNFWCNDKMCMTLRENITLDNEMASMTERIKNFNFSGIMSEEGEVGSHCKYKMYIL